jgi:plastocyanin
MITTTIRRPLFVALGIGACLLGAGCSSSATSSTTAGTAARSSVSASASSLAAGPATSAATSTHPAAAVAATSITIKNFGFTVSGPAKAGATVRVTNNDAEAHSVTADAGAKFDVTIQPGKTANFTAPAAAGSYKFHCSFHSNMHGTLTVTK